MAFLDSCCCCSLLSTAIIIGFFSSFLYGIAFAIELWWIIEAEGRFPNMDSEYCRNVFEELPK